MGQKTLTSLDLFFNRAVKNGLGKKKKKVPELLTILIFKTTSFPPLRLHQSKSFWLLLITAAIPC